MPNKISVVIADDNIEFAEILKNFLNSKGDVEVQAMASDGEEAFKMIAEKEPDVALLDIIMPHLDGIGVLERLASSGSAKNNHSYSFISNRSRCNNTKKHNAWS